MGIILTLFCILCIYADTSYHHIISAFLCWCIWIYWKMFYNILISICFQKNAFFSEELRILNFKMLVTCDIHKTQKWNLLVNKKTKKFQDNPFILWVGRNIVLSFPVTHVLSLSFYYQNPKWKLNLPPSFLTINY